MTPHKVRVTDRRTAPKEAREKPRASDTERRATQAQRVRRIVFASSHSIVDFSNGASVATLDMLQALNTAGFECQVFCTPKLDFHTEVCLEEVVSATRERYHVQPSVCRGERARVLYTSRQNIPITIIRLDSTRHGAQRPEEVQTVLEFFRKFLDVNRPDVMLTYGGDPITLGMIAEAKRRQVPVVFALHNFAYTNPRYFANVDYCLVASEFARRHYHHKVGLDCQVLAYPIDWDRVRVESREPRFVTFVNPCSEKGVYAFARIAHELGRRRPDIPLLVVESRGNRQDLGGCGLDLAAAGNIQVMPHTTDPRRFWSLTRIALLPSLWWENQPLVAIEAMINGIPVIGSNRGGIPEALGECGFTLPLPERLTAVSKIVPEAEEIEPWIETIVRLWDDEALYAAQSARARKEAERWHPDRLRPLYAEFFRNVRLQPGAPVIAVGEGGTPAAGANGPLTPGPSPRGGERDQKTAGPAADSPRPDGERVPKGRVRGRAGRVTTTSPQAAFHAATEAGKPEAGTNGAAWPATGAGTVPMSFVVCVSDDAVLKANLLASPCLAGPGSPHQAVLIHRAPSGGAGLAMGWAKAKHRWVVCVHQDVYLPDGWDRCLAEQLAEAERQFGPIGVAGVYGVGGVITPRDVTQPLGAERMGWVVDRGRTLRDGPELPARVATLDELLLVVRRDSPLRFDPALGFHLYGADLCLQAAERGMAVVALGALCRHDSRSIGLPPAFYESAAVFARKWSHKLPVATSCVIIDRGRAVHVLGNATDRPGSVACVLPRDGSA